MRIIVLDGPSETDYGHPMLVLFHVVTGVTILVLGALAMRAPKRRHAFHGRVGEIYFWVLVLSLGSALVIGSREPAVSFFEIATPPTLAFAVLGYVAAKRRKRWLGTPWIAWHIAGQGGSYIGVVTASGFQVIPRIVEPTPLIQLAIWVIPTVVGNFLIVRARTRWVPAPSRWDLTRRGGVWRRTTPLR